MPARGGRGRTKIGKVMREYARGGLRSSSGQKVTTRKQATAIALSEARAAGARIAKKPRPRSKRHRSA